MSGIERNWQPIYQMYPFITAAGNGRACSNAYIASSGLVDVGADIFERGFCLPSDNKMSKETVDIIIDIIHRCFQQKPIGKNYQEKATNEHAR